MCSSIPEFQPPRKTTQLTSAYFSESLRKACFLPSPTPIPEACFLWHLGIPYSFSKVPFPLNKYAAWSEVVVGGVVSAAG